MVTRFWNAGQSVRPQPRRALSLSPADKSLLQKFGRDLAREAAARSRPYRDTAGLVTLSEVETVSSTCQES